MVKRSEKVIKPARMRGAPDPENFKDDLDYAAHLADVKYENGTFKVSMPIKEQLGDIKKSLELPNTGKYVHIISSNLSPMRAQHLAMDIFLNAIDEYNHKEAPSRHLPYWHTVFGGFTDKLRDTNFRSEVGRPSMLVIDGLAVNATDIKIEKARDLLHLFPDIPRVIVTCGTCPVQFAYEKLFYPVNRITHFGSAKTTTI